MRGLISGLRRLPRPAQRTVVFTVVAGISAGLYTVLAYLDELSLLRLSLIGIGIIAGEMAIVVLPHRRSSGVRFTFGDTALISGLLLASPADIVLGILGGLILWQLVDRAEPVKLLFNVCQYALAGTLAALTLQAVSPGGGAAGGQAVLGLTAAVAMFLLVNTLAVGTIVATTANDDLGPVVRRMFPTNALVTGCNGALALLLVVVWDQNPWVLPALVAPLVLVYMASRLRVTAQLDRERSEAALYVERSLGEAVRLEDISWQLAEAVDSIVGLWGAVWLHGQWRTPVPPGSGPCPADLPFGKARWASGSAFGLEIGDARCVAVGFDGGVLVAWEKEGKPTSDVTPWVERLARSASVHLSRAEAAAALDQERATLRAVVDGTADGIFVLDDEGTVALWNPAMRRLSGVAEPDAIGQPIGSVLGDGPWTGEGVHDVARAGDEESHVWRVAIASVHDDDREQGPLSVAVVHDVTEERRVARMKDDMLAVVSHELRTPLTPIKASARLLSQRGERIQPAQRARLLAEIEQRADHLARLVEDLLLVAQLSSATGSRPRVVPATADLMEVVRQEVGHLGETYAEHTIQLEGPEELVGTTDALRVRQVVANLVDNACKYSPAGATVHVTLRQEGEHGVLEVADEGRGIAPEDRERIFERFERLEDPLHMTTSGAGLGLFIVRALTSALGGEATIEGALGAGTVVTVRLPLAGVPEAPVWGGQQILRR